MKKTHCFNAKEAIGTIMQQYKISGAVNMKGILGERKLLGALWKQERPCSVNNCTLI